MKLKQSFYAIVILALFSLLVGCHLNSSKSAKYDETKDSNYYLSQVDTSSGSAKIDWQLLAIRALINENKLSQANKLLSQLPANLNAEQQKDQLLSQGEIAIRKGQPFNLSQLTIEKLNDSQAYRYYSIKLALDRKAKKINEQAYDYLSLQKFAPEKLKKQTLNNTWNFFSKLSTNQLSKISVPENDLTLKGWIDLSYTYQRNNIKAPIQDGDSPEVLEAKNTNRKNQLKRVILDWAAKYPNHPAQDIVAIITGEQTLAVDNVNSKKVALLLPLSGSSRIFGNTIRQGYVDAAKFYPQEPQQNVIVLDTTSVPMDNLIQQAQEQNVDLIVGPLLKSEVSQIKQLAPSIPVLALNKVDDGTVSANKMCFFALSPEDEAKDAADHIFAQNKQKPLLVIPQNELGRRVAQSFAKQWSQISNGSQAYVQYVGNLNTLRANISHSSGISLTGSPIAFNNDDGSASMSSNGSSSGFDAIYVYASYDELTLIKPMLDMGAGKTIGNGSSSIALYSSSKSHVANASNDFNYDMNQTEYSDIPLIINSSEKTTAMIPSNIQKDYSLTRLYAMGIDAWRLANRFNQLDSYQPNFLAGMTGKLSTSNQCEVTRSLAWQQYAYVTSQSSSEQNEK
ncbi:penicillin-binding protein activator [Gilliamella sp. W8126]|uniref:penicillin-binding protein activator n=1 Tax=Gilliamella sp. W8126 TaxID=2750946 RepID=UPI0018DD914D|nr:penicillin-binding protein activator [Gilliamella sp. W8126]MBI0006866.1 penicillin-binding protein activator [Gilliamella sp. W8126]